MADENPAAPRDEATVPVPELIEHYRIRRQEWMAQADELARLRDEVRGSAEREAMEIVTAARRDIRKIVVEARRELFVLSAQVQAALGDAPPSGPPPRAFAAPQEIDTADDLSAFAEEEWGLAPRATVKSVLEEARADIEILAQDARAVQATPARDAGSQPDRHHPVDAPADRAGDDARPVVAPLIHFGEMSDSRGGRSLLQFGAVVLAASVIVVLATAWALRVPQTRDGTSTSLDATTGTANADIAGLGSTAGSFAAAGAAAAARPAPIRLALEAIRPAWVRAIVDGRPDAGQMLRAGQVYKVEGSSSIALRVGDAGAVRVSVNGAQAQILGRDGQVVNRQFTHGGTDTSQPAAADQPPAPPSTESDVPDSRVDPPAAPPPASSPVVSIASPVVSSGSESAALAADAIATSGTSQVPRATEGESASDSASGAQTVLVAAAQQWLDAYHRQDRAALSSLSTPDAMIVDERPTDERFPQAVGSVARSFARVGVEVAADTAVLTGVMVERAVNGGLQRSTPVSLMWISTGGSWRLAQARLVSGSRLGQIFR